MPADYKLRLGDGTILAVDEAGLRTWLIDGKAMVQPAGSRRWIPLKEVLAQVQAEARRLESLPRPPLTPPPPPPEPPTAPAPPPIVAAPAPTPTPLPLVPPPPAPKPPEPPRSEPSPAEFSLPEPEPFFVPSEPAPRAAAAPPVAKPPVPPAPVVKPAPPVEKAPPVVAAPQPAATAPAPVAAAPPPVQVAPRPAPPAPKPPPPAPPAPAPRATQVAPSKPAPGAAPLDLAEVARTAFVAPVVETASEETLRPPDDDPPIIPFKPLDAAAMRERAKATIHKEEEEDLEEIPVSALTPEPAEDPLMRATRKAQDLLATAAPRVRGLVESARQYARARSAPHATGGTAAPPAPREPVGGPPPVTALPALRFADEKEKEKEKVRGPRIPMRGKLVIAAGVAAILLIATGWAWIPQLIQAGRRWASRTDKKVAVQSPSPTVPTPPPPTLPPEVQVAVDQLPHLTPETIQVVMKKSAYRPRDPAEVFSRAETAAVRGMSALPEEEAKELAALRLAVARSLRPTDRQRVRGYERIRTGRELLSVSEDVKVLALFARGVRALPAEKRERLQTLLAKAIVAELGPLPSPDGTYSAATPGR